MPSVSIILPTFNRLHYLEAAVQSVRAQTLRNWELVIADDGSAAATRAYLHGLQAGGIRLVELQHCGNPARVRNAAIAAARGDHLAFLDSDDVWEPDKLRLQLSALAARPECRWSYTVAARMDARGAPLPTVQPSSPPPDGQVFARLLRLEFSIAMPALMAERTLVVELGGFDEAQRFGEFHDFALRLARASPVVAIDLPLCRVRAHDEHFSADRASAFADWMRLYAKYAREAPNARLRAYSARMRAITSLLLAERVRAQAGARAMRNVLRAALPYAWRYAGWWWGVLKAHLRSAPLTPLLKRLRGRMR